MKNKKFNIDLSINTQKANQALKGFRLELSQLDRTMSKTLGKNIDGLIHKTKTLKQVFKEIAYEMAKTQIQNMLNPKEGKGTGGVGFVLGGMAKGLFFNSGGIVPGSFSQPVPVVAHGSEMILNPSQQSNLFKMLNGQTKGKGTGSYVYAPQITTGASAQDVFDVLNRHSRQFFSMVAEGVHTNNSLRNAVKGA